MEIGNNNARTISDEFHSFIARDVRVGYVMRHFWNAYECPPTCHITVSAGGRYPDAEVQISDHAAGFFEAQGPCPPEPAWREWLGRRLPFFFDPHPDRPLLELQPGGRAHINADLISAAFYLLSGWQEYHSAERDRHGRFPFAASVQCRYGFVAVPVVNYYFDVLKTAVEHVTGRVLRPRRWAGGAPFATFVTHDVDTLHGAWKGPAKQALRRGQLLQFGRLLWQHLTRPDAWDNLEHVRQTVAEYGAKSTFFFLPEHRKAANGTPNADYLWKTAEASFRQLAPFGTELALHGSIGTATSLIRIQQEKARLPDIAVGNRFHYLAWEPQVTPVVLSDAGFAYDSTLGFAEHYGFRNSYCLPFWPYDFVRGGYCSFLEIPLNVMDATLHHPNYLQLAPQEILPALRPMFQEIERFGGVCTVLWHNDHFDPANTVTGPQQFRELLHYLRSRHTAFVNGQDIVSDLRL